MEVAAEVEMKKCKVCGEEKALDAFGMADKKMGTRQKTCMVCIMDKKRKNREAAAIKNGIPAGMKKCVGCLEIKPLDAFELRADNGSRRGSCKDCRAEYLKGYNEENADDIKKKQKEYQAKNKDAISERSKEYREENKEISAKRKLKYDENPEKHRGKSRKYFWDNRDEVLVKNRKHNMLPEIREKRLEKQAEYRKNNKEKIVEGKKKWFKTALKDPKRKLKYVLKSRFSSLFQKGKNRKTGSVLELVGCSLDFLLQHLEKQFYPNPETGEKMTHKNHGKFGWHIDHIKPLASFDYSDLEQITKSWHYTNLQPLWAKENLKKGKQLNWSKK
jgi:hypothetical protein